MSTKVKIILAISGGALVGGLGVCGIVWPDYAQMCAIAAGLVATGVASITGIIITKNAQP